MLSRGNARQDRFANLIIYSSWAGLSLSADNFAKVIFHKPYNTINFICVFLWIARSFLLYCHSFLDEARIQSKTETW